MRENELLAKIAAANIANSYANELAEKLRAIFLPFVGGKVVKADGMLLAKIVKLLPEMPHTPQINCYKDSRNPYRIGWYVKASKMCDEHSCVYYESYASVGTLKDSILVDIDTAFLRADYDANVIIENIRIMKEAEETLRRAKAACNPFLDY